MDAITYAVHHNMQTIGNVLESAFRKLSDVGISTAALDSRILMHYALGHDTEYVIKNLHQVLDNLTVSTFEYLVDRRLKFEPIAYITQSKEFYGYEFFVDHNVLIPRPDTEILVDAVLEYLNANQNKPLVKFLLELGVGSGCILSSILLQNVNVRGFGVDISEEALKVANRNIKHHQVESRVQLIQSDLFLNIIEQLEISRFDIIICNPPYISILDKHLMSEETKIFEPHIALFSDSIDGLSFYKRIAMQAKNFLTEQGIIFLEVGFNQSNAVKTIFEFYGFICHKIYKDLHQHTRVISFIVN